MEDEVHFPKVKGSPEKLRCFVYLNTHLRSKQGGAVQVLGWVTIWGTMAPGVDV